MTMEDLDLFPAWKQAVKALIDDGLTYGKSVSRARIIELCAIPLPKSIEDVRRFDLQVLHITAEIKDTLLTAHCMLLVSDQSGGYEVIPPADQTRHAIEAGTKAMKREMTRMARGVSFVRSELLTDAQRQQNTDAHAKISKLAGMVLPANRHLMRLVDIETDPGHAKPPSHPKSK
ncbi:MAG: hypothetical protein ABI790_05285 [Betaproteobacteria bacterium]